MGGGGGATAGQGLPCDVDAVLAGHCRSCHGKPEQFGAPMSLLSYSDLVAPAPSDPTKKVFTRVGERIHDDASPMPQKPNPRLSAADTATLDAWIAAGAPQGTGTCQGAGGAGGQAGSGGAGGGALCANPLTLAPPTPWTMPTDTGDVYVCYGVDVTPASAEQIIAMAPRVDNSKIVHHILLLESDTSVPTTPTVCDGSIGNKKMLFGWAPGGMPLTLPSDVGYPLDGTRHYMVQIHYNNVAHLAGETDKSGFDLCTTTEMRPNEADVIAFGSVKFTIPAHGALDLSCDYKLPAAVGPINVIGTWPHMHKLGVTIDNTVLPGGTGAPIDLGGQTAWDFNNQYFLPENQTVHGGDVIRTRCAWQNPTDTAVSWGENTSDEMCFSFTMYYPRIKQIPGWSAPAALAKCK
jgi:cytochrome c551/c552